MKPVPTPHTVNEWFPLAHQNRYVETISGQFGLTRRQATCFVRLWGYGALKSSPQTLPLTTLGKSIASFDCSHREAAELFYCDQTRGSERSAGMMVNQLAAKHLVRRDPFDGGPTRLALQIPESFLPQSLSVSSTQLYADTFDARKDATRVSLFLEESYSWMNPQSDTASYQIIRSLRRWASLYPEGLRVLRTKADHEPIGFAVFHPVHPDSEKNFHLPPSSSLHLSTMDDHDPIRIALSPDEDCYAVFVRSWQIKSPYFNYPTACQFLQDTKVTLTHMQAAFPSLCDIYTIAIHPRLEMLAFTLGFKPMKADPDSALRWIHMPLDQFLALDIDAALVEFDFEAA